MSVLHRTAPSIVYGAVLLAGMPILVAWSVFPRTLTLPVAYTPVSAGITWIRFGTSVELGD